MNSFPGQRCCHRVRSDFFGDFMLIFRALARFFAKISNKTANMGQMGQKRANLEGKMFVFVKTKVRRLNTVALDYHLTQFGVRTRKKAPSPPPHDLKT